MNLKCAADGCKFNELCEEANSAKTVANELRAKLEIALKAMESVKANIGFGGTENMKAALAKLNEALDKIQVGTEVKK